jgi:hypothetical protein
VGESAPRRRFGKWTIGALVGAVLYAVLSSDALWHLLRYGNLPWLRHLLSAVMSGLASAFQFGVIALVGTLAVKWTFSRPSRVLLADWAVDARMRRWATVLPAALWLVYRAFNAPHFLADAWDTFLLTNVLRWFGQAIGIAVASRFALKRFADTRPENVGPRETQPDEIVFSAVADTTATRAAVATMALGALAMSAYVAGIRTTTDPGVFGAVLAYVCATIAAAAVFRRASRIAVGLDGVLVSGAGRKRFIPWSSIDDVRVEGIAIVVAKGRRVLVRLQPHGDDAERKDALAARFREAFLAAERAKGEAGHVQATHAAQDERLADSLRGATDYRSAAVTREQLWNVVEGPAAEPRTREVAAEALTHGLDAEERVRLRVAADKCADPTVKASLVRLLAEEEAQGDEEDEASTRRRAAT